MPNALPVPSAARYRPDAITPEVVTDAAIDPRLAGVESLARWMDYAFELPGGFRFGAAGIIGLVPGVGDAVDAMISLYIVTRAIQLGVPRVAIARMLMNVGIEAVAGAVPWVGDLFDIVFKANRRNYLLLKNHLVEPRRQRASDWLFVVVTGAIAMAGIALPVILLVELAKHI